MPIMCLDLHHTRWARYSGYKTCTDDQSVLIAANVQLEWVLIRRALQREHMV